MMITMINVSSSRRKKAWGVVVVTGITSCRCATINECMYTCVCIYVDNFYCVDSMSCLSAIEEAHTMLSTL